MIRYLQGAKLQRAAGVLLAVGLAAGSVCATPAAADEVTSQGTVLRGKVTALSGTGVTFDPEYGTGTLAVKWEKIENLTTAEPFQVLYGEDQEADGPLQGFRDGTLQVGMTPVDVSTIHSGVPIGVGGPSFNDRVRSAWRYWDGELNLGLSVQQGTTDTTGFLLALKTLRSKGPNRLTLGASYRYGTEKKQRQERSVTQDQLLGLIRDEHNFTPRIYGFASGDATYDGVQRLSLRGVPKIGAGYIIWQEKLDEHRRNFLQAEAGPAWIYERYFGGTHRDYFSVAVGALAGYYLPYGAHVDWRLDYLPAVDNFTTDYLLRTEAGLSVPLINPVSAKFSLLDEYDSTPASGAERNSLFLALGVSVVW